MHAVDEVYVGTAAGPKMTFVRSVFPRDEWAAASSAPSMLGLYDHPCGRRVDYHRSDKITGNVCCRPSKE